MKKHLWAICFSVVLVAFSTYIALDTFVISSAYNNNATSMNTSMFSTIRESAGDDNKTATQSTDSLSSNSNTESGSQSETSSKSDNSDADYSDDNITIKMTEYYDNNTKIYVADVTVSSAEYLKTAFASDTYGKNVTDTTSST